MALEEEPIRQPSRALHQKQQAAGGATCTPGAELWEEFTGKPTNIVRCVLCMPCSLSPGFAVKINPTQYLVF